MLTAEQPAAGVTVPDTNLAKEATELVRMDVWNPCLSSS
jgi:hypothetical protein